MRRRMLFGLTAICLGLLGSFPASAQFTESGVPEAATDGASISYLEESGDDPLAPFYSFEVFAFEDEDAASTALDQIPEQFTDPMTTGLEPDDSTGTVDLVPVDDADLDGIDGLGDDARAYRVDLGGDVGSSSLNLLTIRDGVNVHLWIAFVIDFGTVLGDESTTAATPGSTPAAADGTQGAADLVEIGDAWFNGDKPDDGDLIDQLPTVEQLPDGYTEAERYENLDDFESGAGALVGLDRAA